MIVGCCCHDDGCDDSSFDVSLLASFSLTFYRRHRQQHCLRTFVLGAMLRAPVNMNHRIRIVSRGGPRCSMWLAVAVCASHFRDDFAACRLTRLKKTRSIEVKSELVSPPPRPAHLSFLRFFKPTQRGWSFDRIARVVADKKKNNGVAINIFQGSKLCSQGHHRGTRGLHWICRIQSNGTSNGGDWWVRKKGRASPSRLHRHHPGQGAGRIQEVLRHWPPRVVR